MNASKTKRGTDAKRHFNASDLRELFYVVNEKTKCASADLLSKAGFVGVPHTKPCEDATVLKFTMESRHDLVTFLPYRADRKCCVRGEERGGEKKEEETRRAMSLVDESVHDWRLMMMRHVKKEFFKYRLLYRREARSRLRLRLLRFDSDRCDVCHKCFLR